MIVLKCQVTEISCAKYGSLRGLNGGLLKSLYTFNLYIHASY